MRSGLYVCVEDVYTFTITHQFGGGSKLGKREVEWRKGTVVAWDLVSDLPPDPEHWKPLNISTNTHSALVREAE